MFAYSPDALVYDAGDNTWSLRPDYDQNVHRVEIQISDDDPFLDGDWDTDEVGDDANQLANVFDTSGNLLVSGQVYSEEYYTIARPDATESWIDRIEIGGQVVAYIVSEPLVLGETYTQTAVTDVGSLAQTGTEEGRLEYSQANSVPCFGPGIMIQTDIAEKPVEWLCVGDRVLTRDHGFQPLRWVGSSRYSPSKLRSTRGLHPTKIPAGAISPGKPNADTWVSNQHRLLVLGGDVSLLFGVEEALAPALALWPTDTRWKGPITYYHIAFDRHEIVFANGVWMESLLTTDLAQSGLGTKARASLRFGLGLRMHQMRAARLCLKPYEARLLRRSNATGARQFSARPPRTQAQLH